MGDVILTGGRRAGKTIAMERMRHQFICEHPRAIIVELGPNGHCRVEKPVDETDLVPELLLEAAPC